MACDALGATEREVRQERPQAEKAQPGGECVMPQEPGPEGLGLVSVCGHRGRAFLAPLRGAGRKEGGTAAPTAKLGA